MSAEQKIGTAVVVVRTVTQKFPVGSVVTAHDIGGVLFDRLAEIGNIVTAGGGERDSAPATNRVKRRKT